MLYSRSLILLLTLFHSTADPVFSSWYIDKLNIPVRRIPGIVGRNLVGLYSIMAEKMKSSPIALGKGGNPIFAQAKTSQSAGSVRNRVLIPRLALRARVPVRS